MKVLLDENLPHDLRHHLVNRPQQSLPPSSSTTCGSSPPPIRGAATFVAQTHRPVCPFRLDGTAAGDDAIDPALNVGKLRRTIVSDLWRTTSGAASLDISSDWGKGNYTAGSRMTRLDLVGRNHGSGSHPADKKTNFLYLDGHVETKSIVETMPPDANSTTPWEWSAAAYMYSLSGN